MSSATTAANAENHNTVWEPPLVDQTASDHVESDDMVMRYVVGGWFSTHAKPISLLACDGQVRPLCDRLHTVYAGDRIALCTGSLGAVAEIHLSDLCDPQIEGDNLVLYFETGGGELVLGPGERSE